MSENTKIFYVEDDESLAFITKDQLEEEGFEVAHFESGDKAIEQFKPNTYNLAILDIMLPKADGFTIAEKIRSLDIEIPILFLSAKSLEEDRLKGFKIGADDYITKPFSIEELLYKIRVFLKRSNVKILAKNSKIEIGKYIFDENNLMLLYEDKKEELTLKEANLLSFLMTHKNETVKREDILIELWGKNDYFLGRSLDVFISRLRKHLSKDQNIQLHTIRSVGFRLEIHRKA
jgi:DNA-binding response OmpR family regulator